MDANIILGATYDPNLNGTIRVSVVATGTDATMVQALEPAKPHASRTPLSFKRPASTEPSRNSGNTAEALPPVQESRDISHEFQVAVAEAFSQPRAAAPIAQEDDGILVEPFVPAAESLQEPEDAVAPQEQPIPSVYVPSHAARPEGQRRMPRTEELPLVARRTQEAQERVDSEPRNARALFKRLASNVGLNLGHSAPESRQEPRNEFADDAAARSAIEAGGPRASRVSPAAEGAAGSLDAHGRSPAAAPQKDHLEIPAFLRKHG